MGNYLGVLACVYPIIYTTYHTPGKVHELACPLCGGESGGWRHVVYLLTTKEENKGEIDHVDMSNRGERGGNMTEYRKLYCILFSD